jgi:hypothetical protein
MSARSGSKTSRKVVGTYKGFDIIKVKVERYHRSLYGGGYDSNWIESREVYYEFCKEGQGNRPSQAYSICAKNIAECREGINKFIEDDSLYFTDEEREKYVRKPNRKCDYRYGYDSLMKLLKEHQKASKRMKILIEDRLVDANFHHEAGLLSQGDYEKFVEDVRKEYKFREKFEVFTYTECKRIKDPKQFEEGLAKVIEEYLAAQGVKDTTARVSFVENW